MLETPGSSEVDLESERVGHKHMLGLGTIQIETEGHIILVPTPSTDPNDPLNWSRPFKLYVTCAVCIAVWLSNFLAAGPTVDMVQIAIAYTGTPPNIPKTAYLFSTSALMQGVGMFLWMPLITKFGRRVWYVSTFGLCTLCVLWAGLANDFGGELIARLGIGLFTGGVECLAPLTITDIFFLHERGRYMSFYQTFLSVGVSTGIVFSGLIVHDTGNWRNIYWLGTALYGAIYNLILIVIQQRPLSDDHLIMWTWKKSYFQQLALYNGTFTNESMTKIFLRPFGMIFLPAVAWAVMVFSVTIGFLVAVTSNFAVALGAAPYNFTALQSGLCFIGATVGALTSIPFGGVFSDWLAARATRKNGGLREPEMRLSALIPHIIIAPLALVLYGVGIQHGLHWICPTIAFALLSFSLAAGTNISMVYAIEIYKPIAGEVIVAILGFKSIVGFGLSFGTNLWVDSQGYQNAFGEMAAISAFFLSGVFIFILWGKQIRQSSFQWRAVRWMRWHADRDNAHIIAGEPAPPWTRSKVLGSV